MKRFAITFSIVMMALSAHADQGGYPQRGANDLCASAFKGIFAVGGDKFELDISQGYGEGTSFHITTAKGQTYSGTGTCVELQSDDNWNANYSFALDDSDDYSFVGKITGYKSGKASLSGKEFKKDKQIDHYDLSLFNP